MIRDLFSFIYSGLIVLITTYQAVVKQFSGTVSSQITFYRLIIGNVKNSPYDYRQQTKYGFHLEISLCVKS